MSSGAPRTRAPSRAHWQCRGDYRPWDNRYVPYSAGGPVHPSAMAVGLDHALQLAPLYAGARLIADMVASLPLRQYRKPGGIGQGRPMGLGSLFTKPAAYGTVYDWIHMAVVSLVLTGNAWGLITTRDGYGYPTSVEWLPTDRVQVVDDQEQPWNPLRSRIYFYGREMAKSELFHIRAFAVPGKVEGLSPLRLFIELIQQGQDTVGYGASWFRSGGFPPGTFQNQEIEVDQPSADEIRRRLTQSIQRREPLVYGRDWEYKAISVPPEQAQFVQSLQLNATMIAAILGLPPERIGGTRGGSLTYSNQEQNSIELLTDTLRPWMVRLETAFFDALPEAQYVKFDESAMLRTTTEARFQIWKLCRDVGLLTANEIREREEWDRYPGDVGDLPLPQETLASMTREAKVIPAAWAPYLQADPVDQAALDIAKKTGVIPADVAKIVSQLSPPPAAGGGANGNGAANGSDDAAVRRARDIWTGDPTEAAKRARAAWAGDYDFDPASIRALMNGALAH